jgi:predicted HTH domain antitoxin
MGTGEGNGGSWYTGDAMTINIPDSVLESARMSESELRQEIALLLYEKEKVTLAQASRLAEMGRLQFQHLLASRGLFINYEVEDFEQDLATLRRLSVPG